MEVKQLEVKLKALTCFDVHPTAFNKLVSKFLLAFETIPNKKVVIREFLRILSAKVTLALKIIQTLRIPRYWKFEQLSQLWWTEFWRNNNEKPSPFSTSTSQTLFRTSSNKRKVSFQEEHSKTFHRWLNFLMEIGKFSSNFYEWSSKFIAKRWKITKHKSSAVANETKEEDLKSWWWNQ
jgi:ribosomal protein L31